MKICIKSQIIVESKYKVKKIIMIANMMISPDKVPKKRKLKNKKDNTHGEKHNEKNDWPLKI